MERYRSIAMFSTTLLLLGFVSVGIGAEDGNRSVPVRPEAGRWAEIQVLDGATGRGVPLVELETVNGLTFVTDNAGRVAFAEPDQMDQETFFTIRSHGYEVPKDGFGFSGVRIVPQAGKRTVVDVRRKNIAERLCRLTGEGKYRDTLLLGYAPPLVESVHPGRVAGQDSIQAAVYREKVYCFWGDTLRMNYPLGLFRMAGATMAIPDPKDARSDPSHGIAYDYFVDPKTEFARPMMPLPERPQGVIWVEPVFVVPDANQNERLVGHYSRRKNLSEEFERGIAVFDDEQAVFESVAQLPLNETWRRPSGCPIVYEEGDKKWLLFGSPSPNVRVPATFNDVLDPSKYEAFTCSKPAIGGAPTLPDLDRNGRPIWRWQKELPPTGSKTEHRWVKAEQLKAEFTRFFPADASNPSERVQLHRGSVRWNEHRRRWILIAGQIGGASSYLGEVWYAEGTTPTGPFARAVKIVTHDRQTFYNICHHSFMDRDGGRTIHFEGTYTRDFSGNQQKTARYDYNQVLYRLDLEAGDLRAAGAN